MYKIESEIKRNTRIPQLKKLSFRKQNALGIVFFGLIISVLFTSCTTETRVTDWSQNEGLTISQWIEINKEEYSKSYLLLQQARMLVPLSGYNPYGDGYSLFLPTDEAIDKFIEQSPYYNSFEELLLDVDFIHPLARYHTVKRRVHSDEFPDGALADSTLTGERLVFGFFADGDNFLIKVNNKAPIIESNLEMSNGYIHVISDVLQPVEQSGYDWLQDQEEYSILADAMELAGITRGLWWKKYTILAEHDSVYHRHGINNVQDLIDRISSGSSLGNKANPFYQFAAFHMVGGEYYLNEFDWGLKSYVTRTSQKPVSINVGYDIQINKGVDVYGIEVSESGDTTLIDWVRLNWEHSNNLSQTGPIHSITDLLYFEPFPDE